MQGEFAVGDAISAGGIFAGGSCGWCERRMGNPVKKCGLQRCGVVVLRLDENAGHGKGTPRKRTLTNILPIWERKFFSNIFLPSPRFQAHGLDGRIGHVGRDARIPSVQIPRSVSCILERRKLGHRRRHALWDAEGVMAISRWSGPPQADEHHPDYRSPQPIHAPRRVRQESSGSFPHLPAPHPGCIGFANAIRWCSPMPRPATGLSVVPPGQMRLPPFTMFQSA